MGPSVITKCITNHINTPRGRHRAAGLGPPRYAPFGVLHATRIIRRRVRRITRRPGISTPPGVRVYLPGEDGGTRWVLRLLRDTSVNRFVKSVPAAAASTPIEKGGKEPPVSISNETHKNGAFTIEAYPSCRAVVSARLGSRVCRQSIAGTVGRRASTVEPGLLAALPLFIHCLRLALD